MALIDQYKENYKKSPEFVSIQESFDKAINALEFAKKDLFQQLNVDTATWGLKAWENSLNINTDESKSYDIRRSQIKSNLRSNSTSTKQMIESVVESFKNGTVNVIEDNLNYSFTIKFVDEKGIPGDINEIKNIIEKIKPAHLLALYEFTYLCWNEFESYNKNWNELEVLNKTWDEIEVWTLKI